MQLGVVYNEKGKIVNHRSLFKVILNPFLRLIGFNFGKENKLYGINFFKCGISWSFGRYKLPENWVIKKERIFI